MVKKIQNVGHSKGILLDKTLLKILNITTYVNIEIKDDKLIISRYEKDKSQKEVI